MVFFLPLSLGEWLQDWPSIENTSVGHYRAHEVVNRYFQALCTARCRFFILPVASRPEVPVEALVARVTELTTVLRSFSSDHAGRSKVTSEKFAALLEDLNRPFGKEVE